MLSKGYLESGAAFPHLLPFTENKKELFKVAKRSKPLCLRPN